MYNVLVTLFFSLAAHAYNIDSTKISLSGFSSGAYMAGQVHVAHSRLFSGVGLIAGGPYYCARGDVYRALYSCMDTFWGLPSAQDSFDMAKDFARNNWVDSLSGLARSRVFILTGQRDETVSPEVALENVNFYKLASVMPNAIKVVDNLPAAHTFPTETVGNSCSTSVSPFIGRCNYDTAGNLLTHIYGPMNPKRPVVDSHFIEFNQAPFLPKGTRSEDLSLAEKGVAYVPESCQRGQLCRLHVVFHGCRQTREQIQDQFFRLAGYNEWAESNNIIVLYPQAAVSEIINPRGCWDWWGYTGPNFHTKQGPQVATVYNMIQFLIQNGNTLKKGSLK